MNLKEIGCDNVDRIHLGSGSGPVEGFCEHGNEPSDSVKGMDFLY